MRALFDAGTLTLTPAAAAAADSNSSTETDSVAEGWYLHPKERGTPPSEHEGFSPNTTSYDRI